MENPEGHEVDIQQMLDECSEMVTQLSMYNLETWAIQVEVLKIICQAQDVRALKQTHEDLKVRLMSAQN